MMLMSVLLPAPFSPKRTWTSPARIEIDAAQRLHAREAFADRCEPEKVVRFRHRRGRGDLFLS
jgi:hypothetical protein